MNWGVQLGRRFRALKLWMVMRYFGARGLAERIDHHVAQARRVVTWVSEHPDLVQAAPAPLSTVCFRAEPDWAPVDTGPTDDEAAPDPYDELNARWLERINAGGEALLSHTRVDDRFVLRLALGSLHTTDDRLEATLAALDRTLRTLAP
jgi:aromatic-L-amino-acid/L-tryptophan decarboxylase